MKTRSYGNNSPVKVACGVIFNDDGYVFVCRRKQEKSLGGHWEFPGGKVEEGESLQECLKRELLEELDMEVDVKDHLKTVLHDYGTFQIELVAFSCDFRRSSLVMTDHDKFEWVNVSALLVKNLAPADVPIAECLASIFDK